MFRRPGHKLKVLAIVIFFLFTVIGVLVGVLTSSLIGASDIYSATTDVLLGNGHPVSFLVVVLCGLVGMAFGWVNSIVLYAYGSLIDDVETIKNRLCGNGRSYASKPTWMR